MDYEEENEEGELGYGDEDQDNGQDQESSVQPSFDLPMTFTACLGGCWCVGIWQPCHAACNSWTADLPFGRVRVELLQGLAVCKDVTHVAICALITLQITIDLLLMQTDIAREAYKFYSDFLAL